MIKNIIIRKNNSKILFETDPKFYRPNDEIFNIINESENSGFCDFIPINNHYLILENGKYYRIPTSKTNLVELKFFTFKDRHLVNRFVKHELTIEDLKVKLSDRCKQILFNGIIGSSNDYDKKIEEFLLNFEGYPFIYPKHGLKDISELLSRVNAVNGISYLLDSTLTVYEFRKFVCNKEEIKFIKTKDIKSLVSKDKAKCTKQNDKNIDVCHCEEEVDIFERFNTNEENDSDEIGSFENDHTGQLYTNERHYCEENSSNSSFLVCKSDTLVEDDFGPLMESLNLNEPIPSNVFLQGQGSKIKIENITHRNQVLDLSMSPNEGNNINRISDLTYEEVSDHIKNGYKYYIKSAHGNIFFKKLYKKELTGTKKFVRVINLSYKLLKERFYAWFYNGFEFVEILMIDSNSNCCKKDTYIIYLVKNEKKVSDRDLEMLNIHDCDILTDISFQSWDYKHVAYL